jgi:hypothetical protein
VPGAPKWLAPSETKEYTAHRVRAGDVRILANLGTFAHIIQQRKIIVLHLDQLAPNEGAAWDGWLRREQG